jgi:cation transport regulator
MPYRTNEDLPDSIRRHLPPDAQDIHRAAFNHAFAAHAGNPRQEEAAHRIAWAAVKRSDEKIGDSWVPTRNRRMTPLKAADHPEISAAFSAPSRNSDRA